MSNPPPAMVRQHLERRLRKVIADCEESIRQYELRHAAQPDERPFDCEPERVILHKARIALGYLTSNEWDKYTQASTDLASTAERFALEDTE